MNVQQLLENYDVKIVNIVGDEIRCLCPMHDDKRSSFSINSKNGKWCCFGPCGSGGLIKLIQNLEKCTYAEAKEKYAQGGFESSKKHSLLKKISTLQKSISENQSVELSKAELPKGFELLEDESECPEYLLNRLSFKTVKKFGLGICSLFPYKNFLIIPVYFKGEVCGFQARNMVADKAKRWYLMPDGFEIKQYFFNYDVARNFEKVYITEGAFNAMSMDEKGYPNTTASWSASHISKSQYNLLINSKIREIVFCYDADKAKFNKATGKWIKAGAEGVKRSIEMLKGYFKIATIEFPEGEDPNDLSKERLDDVIANRYKRLI